MNGGDGETTSHCSSNVCKSGAITADRPIAFKVPKYDVWKLFEIQFLCSTVQKRDSRERTEAKKQNKSSNYLKQYCSFVCITTGGFLKQQYLHIQV